MKINNPQVQFIKAQLAQKARKEGKPFDKIFTLFLLERAVVRMVSDPNLLRSLIFKGGYVAARVYDSPRFTTDVDAVLHGLDTEVAKVKIISSMEQEQNDGVWFQLEGEVNLTTQSEYGGLRLIYRSGLGVKPKNVTKYQVVHIDVGTGDKVIPKPHGLDSILGTESISWQVYPVETILAEKLHTLITRGAANSRARDVFDIDLLLPKVEPEMLKNALEATFDFRGTVLPDNIVTTIKNINTNLLERGWASAAGYIAEVEDFSSTFKRVVNTLEKIFQGLT